MKKTIYFILFFFLIIYIYKSFQTMFLIPLHDFDEANRAEAAKNMKKYNFYLNPLTGSPFHRIENLKITAKNNPLLSVYYHLERPPLYFWLMSISTSILGNSELSYRLPSFILGITTVIFSLIVSPLTAFIFLTSSDWWLSSQSALMDTTLSFFLFFAFYFLLKFTEKNKNRFLILSAISLGLAFLSKGQPVIIFVFPLFYLLISKKIFFKHLVIFLITFLTIIIPWLLAVIYKFGFANFINAFFGFAQSRTLITDTTQQAPFFWYGRWWIESFRIGWTLFITLVVFDLLKNQISFSKKLLLFYFFASFIFFSIAKNKVWWYVLPLIPLVVFYINNSLKNIFEKNQTKLFNISLIIFLSSLPIFYKTSNKISLFWETILLIFSVFVLMYDFKIKKIFIKILFPASIIFSLVIFLFNFSKINPIYPEIKKVGEYYQKLPQPKCLYLENMPYEAALFYTDAEEINYLSKKTILNKNCQNYLLTPSNKKFILIKFFDRLKLYKL